MKHLPTLLALLTCIGTNHAQTIPGDPDADWLVNPAPYKARVSEDKNTGNLTLENGLARP